MKTNHNFLLDNVKLFLNYRMKRVFSLSSYISVLSIISYSQVLSKSKSSRIALQFENPKTEPSQAAHSHFPPVIDLTFHFVSSYLVLAEGFRIIARSDLLD
jgi:hypothetical protein